MASVSLKLPSPLPGDLRVWLWGSGGPLLLGLWGWADEKKGVKDGLLGLPRWILGQGERPPGKNGLMGVVSLSPAPTSVAPENDIP